MKKISSKYLVSIVNQYNCEVPFVVSEYLCKIFIKNIVCNKTIKYRPLFGIFLEYKNDVRYIFEIIDTPTISNIIDSDDYYFVKLKGIQIDIPNHEMDYFMDKYSNLIFSSSSDSGIEWVDIYDDFTQKENNIIKYQKFKNFDYEKYAGRAFITF